MNKYSKYCSKDPEFISKYVPEATQYSLVVMEIATEE